jgi:carbamoyltransferase
MYILGISAFYHDSAASLIHDETIIAAAQEERFTRIKHDASFPINSIKFCLSEKNIDLSQLDYVVFYEKPFLKFERLLETYLNFVPRGFKSFRMAMPIWIKEKLFQKDILYKNLKKIDSSFELKKILFSEHHLSHAGSAFFPSPFEESLILTMDGVGEWTTTSLSIGKGGDIKVLKEVHFPHSLGLLYSAFTYYCGFQVNSGEYKLMGLAPYGKPIYKEVIEANLIDIKEDGSFRLNQTYFNYCTGLRMTNKKFDTLFGQGVRKEEQELTQFHMDIAASIQSITEDIVIKMARAAQQETGIKNLCLAGGVALNCVANGKLLKEQIFENIWIQPASGDAGGALGCALSAYYLHLKKERKPHQNDSMQGSYLGPSFNAEEIEKILFEAGAKFEKKSYNEMIEWSAKKLSQDKIIGWFQGRMEFGPRSLGNRSIIANPKSETMQKKLNLKIKYRESFRPFAPSVLYEDVNEWFDFKDRSPYMLFVTEILKKHQKEMSQGENDLFGIEKLNIIRSSVPSITHVDYSARIQTVHKETNPIYHDLISKFKSFTKCPIVVNTSFNVRGEPIVCNPKDAYNCFMGTEMDVLVIGNFVLEKEKQDKSLITDYKNQFKLD